MAQTEINRLTNCNIYLGGSSLLGKAEEVDPPLITHKMQEHKALGMAGSAEFFAGIEKMETRIKWSSFYMDVRKVFADPFKNISLQVRSSLETYTSAGRTAQTPVVIYLTVAAKDFPLGQWKQHENTVVESKMATYYIKETIGGQDIVEIDVMANIYKVNGEDVLADFRKNLGV